jgi:hypothetical protein
MVGLNYFSHANKILFIEIVFRVFFSSFTIQKFKFFFNFII